MPSALDLSLHPVSPRLRDRRNDRDDEREITRAGHGRSPDTKTRHKGARSIELRQYEGQGLKTLVPIVLGQTQEAVQKKGGGARATEAKRQWDEANLLADMAEKNGPEIVEVGARSRVGISSSRVV